MKDGESYHLVMTKIVMENGQLVVPRFDSEKDVCVNPAAFVSFQGRIGRNPG